MIRLVPIVLFCFILHEQFVSVSQKTEVQDALLKLLSTKQLKIPVDEVFPFTQDGVRAIYAKQEANKSNGKNILRIL